MAKTVGSYILTKEIRDQIVKDYDTGKYSHEELAEIYFVSPATIGRYIKLARI